jgi:hypothetical protein
MSALALPSFIAPAQVSAPQGSTGSADAIGFMSLLATCLKDDAGRGETDDAMPVAAANDGDEPVLATAPSPALIASPTPAPLVMLPAAPAPESQIAATSDSQPVAPSEVPVAPEAAPPPVSQNGDAGRAPSVMPEAATPENPVAPTTPGPDISPLLQKNGAQQAPTATSTPTATATGATSGPVPDPAPAAVSDTLVPEAAVEESAPVRPEAKAAKAAATATAAAATAVAATQATAKAGASAQTADAKIATPPAVTAITDTADVAPAQASPQPPPPPLRALAERTSRPLDAPVGTTAATSTPSAGSAEATTAAATGSIVRSGSEPTAEPAPSAPKPTAEIVEESHLPSIDAAPAGDRAITSDTSTAQIRETALSGLSRATIEATAQIAAQIQRKLEGRSTRFEMALTPDELGRVDVKLDIDSEGRLAARLAFDNPAAATDLRGRVDDLRRELEEAGFELADDAFEFAERDSGSSGFDRGQDARQGQNRAFAAASRLNAEIDVAQPPRWMALSLSPTGVDVKV